MSTIGNWIYNISGFLIWCYVFTCIIKTCKRTPMRKLRFIEKAVKDNSVTLGKISSYIVYGSPSVHEVEYIYSVNDTVYYLTYVIHVTDEKYRVEEEFQPGDAVAIQIYTTVPVYYDKNNPKKAVISKEVFSSRKCLKQIRTKKKNKFRNIYKDWDGPVIL